MIALALPWVFGAAVAAAFGIAALHLLSVRQPPELLLPTARFLPEREIRAVSRTKRPSDLVLLCLRIGLLLCAGLAAAGPSWRSSTRTHVALIVVSPDVTPDSSALRALVTANDTGETTALVFAGSPDSARAVPVHDEPAALFPLAWREVGRLLANDAAIDSVDLHLVTATSASDIQTNAGWNAWRAAWPGRVVLHALPSPVASPSPRTTIVAGDTVGTGANADDVVRAAFAWHSARRVAAIRADTVHVMRGDVPTSARTAVQIIWPVSGVPTGWARARSVTDTLADSAIALATGGQAIVGPWKIVAEAPHGADRRAFAWWSNGRVAATERVVDAVCIREVSATPFGASDVLLSPQANAFFDALLAPCTPRSAVAPPQLTARMVDGTALASATAIAAVAQGNGGDLARGNATRLAQLLFALALVLLGAEWWWRERAPHGPSGVAA